MGNGPKSTRDAAKTRPYEAYVRVPEPIDVGHVVGTGHASAQGSPPQPITFCELPHRLWFEASSDVPLRLGQPATLVLANPPHVVSAENHTIGILNDPRASAILRCLIDGYKMTGHIAGYDENSGRGEIKIIGRLE